MESQDNLQELVQAIIDGDVAGEDARAILQRAAADLYHVRRLAENRNRQLRRAEVALLYGPGARRADDELELLELRKTTLAAFR